MTVRHPLRIALVHVVAAIVVACRASESIRSAPAGASASSASLPAPVATPAAVPAGRILFYRLEAGEVEHYFTIGTDGSDERAVFTLEGCGCARWSPAGTHIWTMGSTGHGTFSFTTMRPDGTNRVVLEPPIETLNLGPAAASADGRWVAFDGWDETDPSRNGLYLGSPDLTDLSLVMANREGTVRTEPFGVTAAGPHVLFFAETGPVGDIAHAGSLFVVEAGGRGLRQLNPPGTLHGWTGEAAGSLSPDGRQVAFAADNAVYVASIAGGDAIQITDRGGFASAVSWSPTGEWIAYTRSDGAGSVVNLVSPDGRVQKAISADDGSDRAAGATWSPDGNHLLVQRTIDGRSNLWIMNLKGTFIGRVTDEPSTYRLFSWAPASGA
jgi:hypothetical protein